LKVSGSAVEVAMGKWSPKANDIFLEALEIAAAEERAALVARSCGGDADLRAQVEALLAAHERAGMFLEAGAATATLGVAAERPGTVIGSYRLLEQIGEGGFGIVYMAEQEHPIRRKVALKIIKPGMDTRQVIARFEAERQALALMDHPNIAKVFDAGETESGRPYFVMELVKGLPITAYCDQGKLGLRERLELFVPVCQAVQHAHYKGIIHRDIKPSNVLVTLHDGVPVVKVIDFGIAKATGQELTDKTVFTGFAQVLGTPLYSSPEQVALSGLDVDTRTDVYSLGVLLYELLTGSTPFEKERLRQAAYDEMRRIIREEEPPRPSTRVTSSGESVVIAAQRASQPRRLAQVFRGELDWIVMKALEKDRSRRYETPQAFAGDIGRYLANEAVAARPPSTVYRVGKFVRRHRWGTGVAAAAVVMLLVSTGLIWREERKTAAALVRTEAAQKVAVEAAEKEHKAREEAVNRLADMYVNRGMEPTNRMDVAALWFAQAAVTARNDARRVRDNLIRIQNAQREQWTPVAAVQVSTNERLEFCPGNPRYLVTHSRNFEEAPAHVFDLVTERPLPLPAGMEPLGAAAWVSGDRLLVGSALGPVMLLSLPELKVVQQWDAGGPVKRVAASGDGAWVAAASGKRLLVWSSARAGAPEVFEHPETICYLAFAQKEALLVTATADAKARVFSVRSSPGNAMGLRLAFGPVDHDYRPTGAGRAGNYWTLPPLFADHDGVLVTVRVERGDNAGALEWRQVPTGELLAVSQEDLRHVSDIAVSPDGTTVVIGATSISRLYDAGKHDLVSQGPGVSFALIDRTGKLIATYAGTNEIRPIEGGHIGAVTFPLTPTGYAAGLSEGARFVAIAADERVVVYKLSTHGQEEHVAKLDGSATWPGFLPDGKHVFPIGITDGNSNVRHLQVFEAGTGLPASTEMELGGRLVSAAPSPDGRLIAALTGLGDDPRRLSLWDWKSGQQVGSGLPLDFEPRWVDYAPDGEAVVVQGVDGKIILVQPADNRVLLRAQCADVMPGYPWVTGRGTIRFSHDGQTFFTWGSRVVEAWDRTTGRPRYAIKFDKRCGAVAESPDGELLAAAGYDGYLRLWNTREGREIRPIRISGQIGNVMFSPDGRWVCLLGERQVSLWNVRTQQLVCTITPNGGNPMDAAFTPDGRWVITALRGGFQAWEVVSGMPVTFPIERKGNASQVHMDLSCDGHWLALAGPESDFAIIDLRRRLVPADQSPEDALQGCELATGARINGVTVTTLSDAEWMDRWRRYETGHPELKPSPADFLPRSENKSGR
jgi:serine/threonine protein kinase/WD40 repeat protein